VDESEALRVRLGEAGVHGVEDLGRFVSKPEVLGASRFNEREAMPVLIDALPTRGADRQFFCRRQAGAARRTVAV
jgi:hypothetical protein